MNSRSASSLLPIIRRTALRTGALVGVNVGAQGLMSLSDGENAIGSGVALFMVMVVISAGWGVADGARRSFVVALCPWLPAAVLTAVLAALCVSIAEGLTLGEPLIRAFTNLALYADLMPFLFGLVAVPAALGVLVGHLIRRVGHPRPVQLTGGH